MMLVFVGSRKPLVKIGVHEKLTPWGCWRNRHHQKDHGSILHSDSQSKCPDWSTRLWWSHGSCCCRGAHWSQSQRSKDVLRFNMFEFPSPTTNFPANWLSNFCNLFKQNLFLALSGDPAGALYYLCIDGVGEFRKWTRQPHLQSHIWTLSHKGDGSPVIPQLWPSGGSSSGRWCSDLYRNLQSVCAAARSVESAGEHGRQMDANGLCEGPGGEHDQTAQREIQSKRWTMGWRQENTCCCVMSGCRCSLLLFMPLSCKHVSLPVNSIYNHQKQATTSSNSWQT